MSTKKPRLSDVDLSKGLTALEALASAGSVPPATQSLLAKAASGNITAEERAELVKSLAAGDLTARATDVLGGDNLRKSVEVSDYLRESHRGLLHGMGVLAGEIQKSQGNSTEFQKSLVDFQKSLAVSVLEMGEVLAAQGETLSKIQKSLEAFAAAPAAAPKGRVAAAPLEKSMAGADPNARPGLSQAVISDALSAMLQKGMNTVAGEDTLQAAVKFDTSGAISKGALDEVVAFMKSNSVKAA